MDSVERLVDSARMELFTRSGEPFNAPARVQRLADTIVALANKLENLNKNS